MSTFFALTPNPKTHLTENALWVNGLFGPDSDGIIFPTDLGLTEAALPDDVLKMFTLKKAKRVAYSPEEIDKYIGSQEPNAA